MNAARLFIVASGLLGAAGIALSAVAAHIGGGNVGTAATMLLVHAPAFLALGLAGGAVGGVLRAAAWIVLAGLLVFAADLLARHYLGARLFPMAAPAGGALMILGWLVVAISAVAGRNAVER